MSESTDKPIEAEVIEHTQALTVRPQSGLPTIADLEQQFALAVRQRELLSEYIKKQLQPGKHFYEIKGSKPSLTKEGAEIILLPHNLAPDYEIISGPDAPPPDGQPYQITVKCTLRRKGDPNSFVGSGIGSAGSQKRTKEGNYVDRQYDKFLCHNATVKIAEKSAMIAATMNSTAASEFFTQDLEEAPPAPAKPPGRAAAPAPPSAHPPPPKPAPTPKPAPAQAREATAETLKWMIANLEPCKQEALRYCIEKGWILPTEGLDAVPLAHVPTSRAALVGMVADITRFAMTGKIEQPSREPVTEPPVGEPPVPQKAMPEVPSKGTPDRSDERGDWFWDIIVPIPRKGMKRDAYLKAPDTIRSLFDARHGEDDESQACRQRLFGFVNRFEPKTWTDRAGQTRMPSDVDLKFRRALDAFAEWFEREHPGEKL